jgi:squalene monooxygenase
MCLALLAVASRIILPIIWAEGLRAVFFPKLAPKPLGNVRRVESSKLLATAASKAA